MGSASAGMKKTSNWLARSGLPLTSRMPFNDAGAAADHEPAGGLLGDHFLECGARDSEVAADGQRLVAVALEPFFDVVIEAE
jgi:hypothetical protein